MITNRTMTKHMLAAAIALGVLAPAASGHPVSRRSATEAIYQAWFFGADRPLIGACHSNRYGTLCRARSPVAVCFTDAVFGPSQLTSAVMVWVSRTHGVVSAEPVGERYDVYSATPACKQA